MTVTATTSPDTPEPDSLEVEESPSDRKSRLALAGMLIFMGVLHFVLPGPFEKIIPKWIGGSDRLWVYGSGVAELGSGALLLSRKTQRIGGFAALATFVGVYPANIQMAIDTGVPTNPGAVAAWLRLPLQIPMFAWAYRVAGRAKG